MPNTASNMELPSPFEWLPEYELGFVEMDATHHEFVDCVQALTACDETSMARALDRFAEHARRHFAEEDQWMAQTAYGSAGCHVDEHAAVLRSLDEVRALVAALDPRALAVVHAFALELARWFPGHAQMMDQGLARWMVKLRLGGSPMVIHRRQTATA